MRLPKSEDRHHQRADENLRLLAEDFVEQQSAARDGRGKEKLNLRCAEGESSRLLRQCPWKNQDGQRRDREDVDEDVFDRQRETDAGARIVRDHSSHEHEPKVGETGDESVEIARLAQTTQPQHHAILE